MTYDIKGTKYTILKYNVVFQLTILYNVTIDSEAVVQVYTCRGGKSVGAGNRVFYITSLRKPTKHSRY